MKALPPVVLAETYPQFCEWCRENKVSSRSAIFAVDPVRLMGLEGNPIIRTDTWKKNPCALEPNVHGRSHIGYR